MIQRFLALLYRDLQMQSSKITTVDPNAFINLTKILSPPPPPQMSAGSTLRSPEHQSKTYISTADGIIRTLD